MPCALLPLLTLALSSGGPPRARGWRRAWQTRGIYTDRADMLPLPEIAAAVGIAPPISAPRWLWQAAWRGGKRALPLLHRWDPVAPANTCQNAMVLWLKAIAGNRKRGGYPDGGLSYDLLPPVTRRLMSPPLVRAYPRMHHQNVAIRTAYIDRAILAELKRMRSATDGGQEPPPPPPPRVIILGAGFDVIAFRLDSRAPPGTLWTEIDLPSVTHQKSALVQRRLLERRPQLTATSRRVSSRPFIPPFVTSPIFRSCHTRCFESLLGEPPFGRPLRRVCGGTGDPLQFLFK